MSQRDLTLDVLRGLAIFVMIGANMGGAVLEGSQVPFWFRCYSSLAAPLFILVSGMMVALTAEMRHRGLKHFFVRGAMIVVVGVFVDVLIWKILPFTTVDVLYLIGVSLPLAGLFLRLPAKSRWIVVISIFLLTPVLQNILGYSEYPSEFFLTGVQTVAPEHATSILAHWIVDGWFPVFPWLGFSLLGANLADLRRRWRTFGMNVFLFVGIGVSAVGSLAWWLYPGQLLTRAGYF